MSDLMVEVCSIGDNFWETYYYTFDKIFNIPDERVCRQEDRFDLSRMKCTIVRLDKTPDKFDDYNIGGIITGIYENWNVDHVALGNMSDFIVKCMQYYLC